MPTDQYGDTLRSGHGAGRDGAMLVLAREVASGAYGVARAAATIWVGCWCAGPATNPAGPVLRIVFVLGCSPGEVDRKPSASCRLAHLNPAVYLDVPEVSGALRGRCGCHDGV